ncbi:MAG: hypothetical protein NUV59_00830 [Patescibacteria group bacterium]|nr:hypothetical protein [Patescibacteria group bacterium]
MPALYTFYPPYKPLTVAALVSGLLLFVVGGFALYQAHADLTGVLPALQVNSASAAVAALSAETAPEEDRMQEVHIANNGLVLLRGVRVTSVSGGEILVVMTFGESDLKWTVHTKRGTEYFIGGGEKGTLADIAAGDILSVTGMLVKVGEESVIEANYVRE